MNGPSIPRYILIFDIFMHRTCFKDEFLSNWHLCRLPCPKPSNINPFQWAFNERMEQCEIPKINGTCEFRHDENKFIHIHSHD